MEKYILTIDMGTTAFKASLFDCSGNECASSTEEYQLITPQPGQAEMEVSEYVNIFKTAVSGAISKAKVSPEEIVTLGISCQAETTVFLDKNSMPVRPAIVWCDNRAAEEASEIVDEFGSTNIQRHTGQVGRDPIWPGAKLLWLKKHERQVFDRIDKIVQLNGFFTYLLTGRLVEDDSMLGSSIYWNISTREYWDDMLGYIGISRRQLPEVVRPGSLIGKVTAILPADLSERER